MRTLYNHYRNGGLRTFVLLSICAWVASAKAQSVTWEICPWPDNQDWGAQRGQPAVTNGNQVILSGQAVRTVQSFSGPTTFSFDLNVQSVWHLNPNGTLQFYFTPLGLPVNLSPAPALYFGINMLMAGGNSVDIESVSAGNIYTRLWEELPMNLGLQTTYHFDIGVSETGHLSYAIDEQAFSIPDSVVMAYSAFQVRLDSWQPGGDYEVSNFTAVPEPATWTLLWLGAVTFFGGLRLRPRSS